jgi:chemotaxis protein histidine kinase CheA
LDSLYRINFLPGKKLPPDLSRKDEVYLFVEYEEKFRAGNIGKLLNYVGIVTEEYFTNLRKNFIINSVVIYGPKIKPPKTFKSNDDISEHKTISLSPYPVKINFINIYLSKINQEKVFAKIKDKIDQGKKLNNFNLFELLTLPRIGKFDIDLLTKCFHVATDPAINSKDGIERFKYYFDILFFDSLNNDQKKIFKKELVMSQYFQKMHEEYAKEAVQRAEQEFQAKKEVEMQELQAKHRAEMQALQRAKEKAEQELQAKHRAEMQALQRAKEKAEQRAKKEAEQRAKEKAEHRAEMQALQRAKEKAEQRAKKEAEQRAKEKAKKPSRGPRS